MGVTVPAMRHWYDFLNVGQMVAARQKLGMQCVAGLVMYVQHLARDLRVAWLICAYEAEPVAAEERDQSVEQQEDSNRETERRSARDPRRWDSRRSCAAIARGVRACSAPECGGALRGLVQCLSFR